MMLQAGRGWLSQWQRCRQYIAVVAIATCWQPFFACSAADGSMGKQANHQPLDKLCQTEFTRGRYREALAILQQAISQKSTPERLVLKGRCLEKLKRFDESVAAFSAALALRPDYAAARFGRAWAHLGSGDNKAVIADCDIILRSDPRHANALDARGLAYIRLGKAQTAASDLEKSVQLDPDDPEKLYHLGCAYGSCGKLTEAAHLFTRYIAREPGRVGGYISRAQCFGALKQFDRALEDLRKARKFDGNGAQVDMAQAQIELKKSHPEKVPALINRALAVKPDADAYELRAKALKMLGNYNSALADWTKAIEIADSPQRRAQRADCFLQAKKPSQAEQDARIAIKNSATVFIDPHRFLTIALIHQKKFVEAVEAANAWKKLNPVNDDEPYRLVVYSYESLRRWDKALASLRQWQKARPSAGTPVNSRKAYDFARADIVQQLEAKGKHVGSETTFATINERIKQYPQEAAYYAVRAEKNNEVFEFANARSDFNQAVKLDPFMADALIGRANLFKQSGQHALAINDLNEVLRLHPHLPFALLQRGKSHAALHDYKRAVADFTELVRAGNATDEILGCRAEALWRSGQLKLAEQDCHAILKHNRGHWGIYRDLARIHESGGDTAAAILDLTQAIKIAPNEINILQERAKLYEKNHQAELARKDRQMAEKLAGGILNDAPFRSK